MEGAIHRLFLVFCSGNDFKRGSKPNFKKANQETEKNLLYTCFPIVFLLFCDILLLRGFLLTADLLCNCRL